MIDRKPAQSTDNLTRDRDLRGVEPVLALTRTVERLLRDQQSEARKLDNITQELRAVSVSLNDLVGQVRLPADQQPQSWLDGEVPKLLEMIAQHLMGIERTVNHARDDQRLAEELSNLRDTIEKLPAQLLDQADDQFKSLGSSVRALSEKEFPGADIDIDALAERLFERLQGQLVNTQAEAPAEADLLGEVSQSISSLRSDLTELKNDFKGAVNPDRALILPKTDWAEAEKASMQRVQAGFQLLLTDLTTQADVFREKTASIELPDLADQGDSSETAEALKRLEGHISALVAHTNERQLESASSPGRLIHQGEKESLQRIQLGFRLLLRDLTGEVNTLRDAIAGLISELAEVGLAGDVQETFKARLAIIADALADQIIQIRPTVEEALQLDHEGQNKPASVDNTSALSELQLHFQPLEKLAGDLGGIVSRAREQGVTMLGSEDIHLVQQRIHEFMGVAIAISRDIDKSISSR